MAWGERLELMMEQAHFGQRVRVNLPGAGDHGQEGTIKKVRNGQCYVHLDWDHRLQHLVMFYATDLEHLSDAVLPRHSGNGASD